MFSAERRFLKRPAPAGTAPVRQGVSLPKASLLLAALSVGTAGCALQVHEGDGLATDGVDVQISPTTVGARPGGTGGGGGFVECKHLDLFTQTVMPLLLTKFQGIPQGIPNEVLEPQSCVSCHEDKSKAIFEMFIDATSAKNTCQVAYARQVKQGDILASSDPAMPLFEHEFKFQKIEEYNRFRDAVQAWITAEGIVTQAKPKL